MTGASGTRRIAARREGVMLDRLTHEAGGRDADAVAALDLNPGLADQLAGGGHILPPGLAVIAPEITSGPARLPTVKLWD